MPYELVKVGKRYQVITTTTGKPHSKKPMSKKNAEAQLRILNAHTSVVDFLGGAIGYVKNSAANRTAADLAKEQAYGENISGVISGTPGLLVSAASVISSLPEVENFARSLGIQTAASRAEARDEADTKRIEDYFNQAGVQHYIEMNTRAQEANLNLIRLRNERAGNNKVYTEEEIQAAIDAQQENAFKEASSRELYDLQRKALVDKQNAERLAHQRAIAQEQNQQYQSGLNQKSLAVQSQVTNVQESLRKARLLQQQRVQDQQLFLTKAEDIRRKDFFDQERVAAEARQTMIAAEQRRQAIKAAALAAAPPNPVTSPQMIPTLGRRLPPSVLWHP